MTVLKRSDDSASNVGYALVYQCLRTITRIYPSQELLDQATLTISRFLSSTSKNLKYMGIMGLIQIVKIDPKYFRPTEVELLIGDPTKAKEKLGWVPTTTMQMLCKEMVQADIKLVEKGDLTS